MVRLNEIREEKERKRGKKKRRKEGRKKVEIDGEEEGGRNSSISIIRVQE